MSDYFLIHRAVQVQRLCTPEAEDGVEIPGRFSRDGLTAEVAEFLRCVDRIRKLPLDEKSGRGLMELLRGAGTKTEGGLTSKQRQLIEEFETQLIELRLSGDPQASQVAAKFIQAILKDRSFFFGLKPLPQHSDDFAYEFLYPTWLNLYTALRVRAGDGQPKFSDRQVNKMFGYLRQLVSEAKQSSQQFVGCLTFAANRFAVERALDLALRLTRLCSADSAAAPTHAERIGALQEQSPSAGVLKELLTSYLLVECHLQGEAEKRPENATRGEFPEILKDQLRELSLSSDQFNTYQQLLITIGKIVERAGGFDEQFGQLFSTGEYDPSELLDLCLSADNGHPACSCQVQRLVARVIQLESGSGEQTLQRVRDFAHHLARRTDALEPDELKLFVAEFIEKDNNRGILLASAGAGEKRRQIAEQLLKAARSESDEDRFLCRLQAAALIGTWQDYEGLEKIVRAIKVLRLVKQDESISRGELGDLVEDLRANLPASLVFLESPGLAGRGKSDRLAKIYLALNEACHMYSDTNRTGNFGLIRAAYRNLDPLVDE